MGTTDSEAVFLALVGAGIDQEPVEATRRVLQSLCNLVNENGHRERLRFTAALANGRDLFAFRFAENDTANSLYYREDGERLIVVSEPYDRQPDWTEVPVNHALVALASRTAQIIPLLPATDQQELLRSKIVIARVQ